MRHFVTSLSSQLYHMRSSPRHPQAQSSHREAGVLFLCGCCCCSRAYAYYPVSTSTWPTFSSRLYHPALFSLSSQEACGCFDFVSVSPVKEQRKLNVIYVHAFNTIRQGASGKEDREGDQGCGKMKGGGRGGRHHQHPSLILLPHRFSRPTHPLSPPFP